MATNWTKEQESAIYENGSNILVAAAAGSGKTTVLVERIIQKIIKENIDIDRLLVVTFTNAAASEMRERILQALYKQIEKNPNDAKLQKQIVLLNKASICTIDSFCLDVLRNNFFEIGISSNFRIADNTELELLKQETIEELFEDLYISKDEDFAKLIETYTGYKSDDDLKNIILKIYNYIQSNPFPEEWLEKSVEEFNLIDRKDEDFANTIWGRVLINNFHDEVLDCINNLKVLKKKVDKYIELEKYSTVLQFDIDNLSSTLNSLTSWDSTFDLVNSVKFKTWPTDKNVVMDLKDYAKQTRDIIKEKYKNVVNKTFLYNSSDAINDLFEMYPILVGIKKLVLQFLNKFKEKKQEKNLMDFSDIEHYALQILLKKDENGNYIQTDIAKKYQEKFFEIAIDEYQDSNLVQEFILTAISKGNNIFMVGDVKQSIYKFRQARPDLFLDKYDKYSKDKNEYGQKIQLFKNFRSREEVINLTNLIFDNIMSKKLGDINYSTEEYLNYEAKFEEPNNNIFYAGKPELNIIDISENKNEDDDENEAELLEKAEIEAKFVAKKIRDLLSNNYQVYDKKIGYRKLEYKDIVILLRATSDSAMIFEKELYNSGIPVFSDSSTEYLDSIEIQTIISLLKILDNPINDIPLVTVLRSPIGGFTDNDLIEIRLVDKESHYYDALKKSLESKEININLKSKISNFIENLNRWKNDCEYLPLNELIWKIYVETGYYSYVGLMPNGELRQANLKMLFERAKEYEKISFKGLFNFVKYIEKIKNSNTDLSSAKVIGENENVVRIMSIHKSKGLEFPVVFLSRTDKKFNMRDLNENILLHQELGFGPKYINYNRRIEYNTAAKEAIKIKAKEENISEEMRILYVALTRAKEKLIITGIEEDFDKELEKKKELLEIYEKEDNKINHLLLKKYNSYLDWIELVSLNNSNIEDFLEIRKYNKSDVTVENKDNTEKRKIIFDESEDLQEIDKILNWKYNYINSTTIPSKTSVTKIKELINKDSKFEEDIVSIKPKFMQDDTISNAEKGSLVHLVLQKLDLKQKYNINMLKDKVEELFEKQIITEKQKEVINIDKILSFTNSSFAERIRNAKEIYKEKPFYTYIPAKDIYGIDLEEKILVQGVIDLYFLDEEDNIILVDYKTDYVKDEKDLIDKYKVQLEIYKKALEESLNKKVYKTYIYSIYLEREIEV